QGLNVCRAGFCRPRHGVRTIHERHTLAFRQISALGEIADHAQAALLRALELLLEPLLLARRIAAVPRLETLLLDAQQMMRDAPLLRLQVLLRRLALRTRGARAGRRARGPGDRKSTRLNSSHVSISYAV